ncbi:MAG: ThuA domain-containing protein, partial [Armatimonadota bacterium]
YHRAAQQLVGLIHKVIVRTFFGEPAECGNAYLDMLGDCLSLEDVKADKLALPVFTTNYDQALEVIARFRRDVNFVDGIQRNEWSADAFDMIEVSKPTLAVFRLHGSARWHRREGEEAIHLWPDLPQEGWKAAVIWPEPTKVAYGEPFDTCYEYLQRCLDEAELCVVVGYSFNDESARQVFRRALRKNDRLGVLVADPNVDGPRGVLLDLGFPGKLIRVWQHEFDVNTVEALVGAITEELSWRRVRPPRWPYMPPPAGDLKYAVAVYCRDEEDQQGLDASCTNWLRNALGGRCRRIADDDGLARWLDDRSRGVCVLAFARIVAGMAEPAQEALRAFVQQGGGLVGTHDAIASSVEQPVLRGLFGVAAREQLVREGADVERWVRQENQEVHSVLQGVTGFQVAEGAELLALPPESFRGPRLLSARDRQRREWAVAWARWKGWAACEDVGEGRVVYAGLGHEPATYEIPQVRTFLANAIRWAGRFDEED